MIKEQLPLDLEIRALLHVKTEIENGRLFICNRLGIFLETPRLLINHLTISDEVLKFIPGADSVEEFLYGVRRVCLLSEWDQCKAFRLNMLNVMLERRGVK